MTADRVLVARDARGALVAVCADGWSEADTFRRDQKRAGRTITPHPVAEARALVRAEGTVYTRAQQPAQPTLFGGRS